MKTMLMAAVAAFGLTTMAALPAYADWSAIAVGYDDGVSVGGYSGTSGSQNAAIRKALAQCDEYGGRDCEVKIIWTKGCNFFVKGDDGQGNENWAIRHSKSLAREVCEDGGFDCSVKWVGGCLDIGGE